MEIKPWPLHKDGTPKARIDAIDEYEQTIFTSGDKIDKTRLPIRIHKFINRAVATLRLAVQNWPQTVRRVVKQTEARMRK